jgi:hypothetical protein
MTPTYTLDQIQATPESCLDHAQTLPEMPSCRDFGDFFVAQILKLPPTIPDLPETPISESAMVRATLLSALTALRINGNAETLRAFTQNLHHNLTPILQKP